MSRPALTHETQRIYYELAGAGPPVILIHGLGGSTRWWRHSIPAFSRHFRVHAIDLIGFGASRPGRFVLDDAGFRLVRWMDRLTIARAHIVGHSMGGYIAAEMAADFPDRIDKLVLVNAAAMPLESGPRLLARRLKIDWRTFPMRLVPILLQDTWRAKPWTIWNAARQLLSRDLRPKLNRIRASTLVVAGAHDTLIPASDSEALSRIIPNAAYTCLPNSGHNCLWDRPIEFNEAVIRFLVGADPKSSPAQI